MPKNQARWIVQCPLSSLISVWLGRKQGRVEGCNAFLMVPSSGHGTGKVRSERTLVFGFLAKRAQLFRMVKSLVVTDLFSAQKYCLMTEKGLLMPGEPPRLTLCPHLPPREITLLWLPCGAAGLAPLLLGSVLTSTLAVDAGNHSNVGTEPQVRGRGQSGRRAVSNRARYE